MFKVAILDDYQRIALSAANWSELGAESRVEVFHDNLVDISRLVERLHGFDAVVLMRERTPFPRALFERLPNLRLVITAGMRNAAIDMAAATECGVLVTGTDSLGYPTAELTWGLILSMLRHLPHEAERMRQGKWQVTVGRTVKGKTLGVMGLGKLGSQVTTIARAFGMGVLAWSQNLTAERATAAGATLVSKQELLEKSDVISIHLVLSERTRNLIDAAEFRQMKPTAWLVNTSRGPIVNEAALLQALRERRISGAALDVYDQEPLPLDHPLRSLDNVVLTPHLGYVTAENYELIYGQAVENIRAFLEGKPVRCMNSIAAGRNSSRG